MALTNAQKQAQIKYKLTHQAELKARWKKYYAENKERIKELRRQKYLLNRDTEKSTSLKWRNKNIEKARKSANSWAKANRDKRNTKWRERYRTDIVWRISLTLRQRLNKLLRGEYKGGKSLQLLGCSLKEFRNHIESKFQDGMSWDNYGLYGWHIDHIKPISSFDLSKEEDQKTCFNHANMQPLWAKDNLIKGNKI